MKRFLLLSLLAIATAAAFGATRNSSIRYERQHTLMQDGDDINVVDIDVEWPEYVDGFKTIALEQYLNANLLGSKTQFSGFDAAISEFRNRFGHPVDRQFKTVPDDNCFCYIDLRLKQIGHIANRYISFSMTYRCSPEKLSTQKADTISRLITYDLQQQRVLAMRDLIRTGRIEDGYYDTSMVLEMARNASIEFSDDMIGVSFVDGCMKGEGMTFSMLYIGQYGTEPFTTYLGEASNRPLFTKTARNILEKAAPIGSVGSVPSDSLLRGEPVYNKVDAAPEFNFGGMTLATYLSKNISYPDEARRENATGTVEVGFIVDTNGDIRNVRITRSVSPELDRAAANVVRLMPRWKPGTLAGKPANVCLYLPIRFGADE